MRTCWCSARVHPERCAARSWGASLPRFLAPRRRPCSWFPPRRPVRKERNDWLPCGAPPALREGVVHVWYVELDVDDDVHARLADVTSEAERARARRLRIASAARRFLS